MTGTFVLSLDTELAWGTMDKGGFRTYRRHLERTRQNIESLLALLERYEIPATWAFVGHLLLDSCRRETAGADPHPDVLTAQFPWYDRPWHHHDPAGDRQSDPFWYGDDIFELVRKATPEHEVGCHTFSHLPLNDPAVSRDIAASQVRRCCELASDRGIQLESFVYPRNRVAHLDVLVQEGFTSYRGPERSWYGGLPGPAARAGHFAHRLFGFTPPVYHNLQVNSGVVNIPASMFLMPPDGVRAMIPGRSRIRQAVRGLKSSARSGALFHLWFHPWNIGPSGAMLEWLDAIFGEVDRLRADGSLRVMTMGSLAEEVLAGTK